jgi:hypothetical protein
MQNRLLDPQRKLYFMELVVANALLLLGVIDAFDAQPSYSSEESES